MRSVYTVASAVIEILLLICKILMRIKGATTQTLRLALYCVQLFAPCGICVLFDP